LNKAGATLGDDSFYTNPGNWDTPRHFANSGSNTFDEDNPWKWDEGYGVGTKGRPRMSWEELTP